MKKIKSKRPYFGYRRMWAWLSRREDQHMNKKKVYRLMKENKLLCKNRRYNAKRKFNTSKPKPTKKNQ